MIKVQDHSLMKLLPHSLRGDPVLVAVAEAAEIQLKQAYREAENIFNLVDIENVPEQLLDLLSYEKHVDFYEVSLPIKQKQSVVKNSIKQHRKKGTPYAIELALAAVGLKGEVVEWFEYDDKPYTFKVVLAANGHIDLSDSRIVKMIKSYKNTRSHFSYFEFKVMDILILIKEHTYEFGVPYPITNRFRTTDVNGRVATTHIKLLNNTYSFGVPYPITNVLRTEAKNGKVASEKVRLQSNAYAFRVLYPICSQFHIASIGIDNQKEYVQVTTEYRSNEVLYKRAGTIFAGEGDI